MTLQIFSTHRRRLTVALACLITVGCATAPSTAPPDPKETRQTALRKMGFVPAGDGWELSLGVKLLFDTDVDAVSDEGRTAIGEVARTLTGLGVERLRVEGHTDNVGSAKYNAALSLRRADSVAQQLVANGWQRDAIERRGYGADKPIADNATAQGRAQNRRVVIAVPVE
jgi:outer membrane protein OmpA-like peptidoglycan-associated protein